MMNRKMGYAALCAVLTITAAGCGGNDTGSRSSGIEMQSNSVTENVQNISLDEVKSIVLGHAGLNENDVVFSKTKLEHDDGTSEYSVEFTADNIKYEYEVGAADGAILEFSSEIMRESQTQAPSQSTVSVTTIKAAEQITLDEAKSIALKHAGVTESAAVFTKTKLDYDDGVSVYDIEFTANGSEYEYEIKASDGSVLESSVEKINAPIQTTVSVTTTVKAAEQVTLDKAKEIALKHAGVKSSEAVFTKAKLDYDDGVSVYDIEFTANGSKYEYEIKASDGSVLESSVETMATVSAAVSSGQITLDEAKDIALKHAGVKSSEAVFTKTKLDYDDGVSVYDIEFTANGSEYEYEIKASDGSVLESSVETKKQPQNQSASSQITLEEAKDIALKHAGFTSSQVKFKKSKLDYDDGVAEYEMEFRVNGYEYEYKINAETGKIIEYDIDD